MPVRVNLVDIEAKRVAQAREREARAKEKPDARPNLEIREKVMDPVRKEPRKAYFMADIGLKK